LLRGTDFIKYMWNRILYLFAYNVEYRIYFDIKCTICTGKAVGDGPWGGGEGVQYAVCLENGHSLEIHVARAVSQEAIL
jgi:hypothetical protein